MTPTRTKSRRMVRAAAVIVVIVAALLFVLTSCPSQRDGIPGRLATAKEQIQSAARSGALSLQLWLDHRSTRQLTSVQLADARDEVAKAYKGVATLKADSPVDLHRQVQLTTTMTSLINDLNTANMAVGAAAGQSHLRTLQQRLLGRVDALEREYR